MPFPNFHSARIKEPGRFDRFTYKSTAKGVDLVIGWKGNDSEVQAYRFEKTEFSAKQAREWLQEHNIDYISFEKAENETKNNEKLGYSKTFQSRFLEPGLVSYKNEGEGIALLTKEEIEKDLYTFIGCPLIIDHNDKVSPENPDAVQKHEVGKITRCWYNAQDGWFWCEGVCDDSEAEEKIINENWKVSCSFDCEYPKSNGEWHAIPYTNLIEDLKFNHLAIVENPRYEGAIIEFIEPKKLINSDINLKRLFNTKDFEKIQEAKMAKKEEKSLLDKIRMLLSNDKKNDDDEKKNKKRKNDDDDEDEEDGEKITISKSEYEKLKKIAEAEEKEKEYMKENDDEEEEEEEEDGKKKNKKKKHNDDDDDKICDKCGGKKKNDDDDDDDDDDDEKKVLINEEEEEEEEKKKNKKKRHNDDDDDEDEEEKTSDRKMKKNSLDERMNSRYSDFKMKNEVVTSQSDMKRAQNYFKI